MAQAEATTERAERVSTLELFFDLVFVFTVTQLTALLAAEPDAVGLVKFVLLLLVIWWMYDGYAWLTNALTSTPSATGRSRLVDDASGCRARGTARGQARVAGRYRRERRARRLRNPD